MGKSFQRWVALVLWVRAVPTFRLRVRVRRLFVGNMGYQKPSDLCQEDVLKWAQRPGTGPTSLMRPFYLLAWEGLLRVCGLLLGF